MRKHIKELDYSRKYKLFIAYSFNGQEYVGRTPLKAARLCKRAMTENINYQVGRIAK